MNGTGLHVVRWFVQLSGSYSQFAGLFGSVSSLAPVKHINTDLSVCILYACLFHMSSVCTSLRHEHFVNPAITINLSFSNCFIHHVD